MRFHWRIKFTLKFKQILVCERGNNSLSLSVWISVQPWTISTGSHFFHRWNFHEFSQLFRFEIKWNFDDLRERLKSSSIRQENVQLLRELSIEIFRWQRRSFPQQKQIWRFWRQRHPSQQVNFPQGKKKFMRIARTTFLDSLFPRWAVSKSRDKEKELNYRRKSLKLN
jgi:hypothetical protein